MKERIKSTPYFSAYSLKALELSAKEVEKVEKKNHNKQFSRVINRLRILPLEGSYAKKISINKINIPTTIPSPDKNWFINYE